MKQSTGAHLWAASRIVEDRRILVIGSQAILLFPDEVLPSAATHSIKADIAFLDDESEHKARRRRNRR